MFSDVVSHVAWFSEFDCGFLVSLFGGFYVWVCVTWSVFVRRNKERMFERQFNRTPR